MVERTEQQRCRWHAVPDAPALHRAVAQCVLVAADEALRMRGVFSLVLAGGNTPRGVYELLRDVEAWWPGWHIYFGDERCAPVDDPSRNSRMAELAWLDHVPIAESQRHPIPAELGPREGANAYSQTLETVGEFDLVLLGLGEDGHTASLFPGHEMASEPGSPSVLAVFDAPKPPPCRVTMSAARLSNTRQAIFLVTGDDKRDAVSLWRAARLIPARAIAPAAGVDVYVESALLPTAPGASGLSD